jgi:hypothetical protein
MNATTKIIALLGLALVVSLLLMSSYVWMLLIDFSIWVLLIDLLAGIALSAFAKQASRQFWGWVFISAGVTVFHFVVLLWLKEVSRQFVGWIVIDTMIEDFPFGLPYGLFACGIGLLIGHLYQRFRVVR